MSSDDCRRETCEALDVGGWAGTTEPEAKGADSVWASDKGWIFGGHGGMRRRFKKGRRKSAVCLKGMCFSA